MEDDRKLEFAEAIPFNRVAIAHVLEVPLRTVNNWIDRNELWQTPRRGYYRLSDVFDLAGFSALRTANVPERECARYVRNYGFYRCFLHGDQFSDFSFRAGKWDIGVYDPHAIVTLRINMRTVGEGIFRRVSELLAADSSDRSTEDLGNFQHLYRKAIKLDRLWPKSAPLLEADQL